MQQISLIEDTFGSFTAHLHAKIGDRVETNSALVEFVIAVSVVLERMTMKIGLTAGVLAGAIL